MGKKGSISLDLVARKVLRAAITRGVTYDLTLQERLLGADIEKKLITWYKTIDQQVEKRNFFTRFLYGIRNYSSDFMTPKYYVENIGLREFRAFKEKEFTTHFGPPTESNSFFINSRGVKLWCVKDNQLRELAART